MPDYKQMGLRLTKEQREELERIAKETGVEVAQVVRFAVDALIRHYKRCGNKLILPIEFGEHPLELLKAAEPDPEYRTKGK